MILFDLLKIDIVLHVQNTSLHTIKNCQLLLEETCSVVVSITESIGTLPVIYRGWDSNPLFSIYALYGVADYL